MARKKETDVMANVRAAFAESGISLEELGTRMGHDKDSARKSAWQLLNKIDDPRLSTLQRFAAAIGKPLGELVN